MPVSSQKGKITEDGIEKEVLTVSFTNGALAQLEELKKFIGTDDLVEVVKVAISFVQNVKEHQNKESHK